MYSIHRRHWHIALPYCNHQACLQGAKAHSNPSAALEPALTSPESTLLCSAVWAGSVHLACSARPLLAGKSDRREGVCFAAGRLVLFQDWARHLNLKKQLLRNFSERKGGNAEACLLESWHVSVGQTFGYSVRPNGKLSSRIPARRKPGSRLHLRPLTAS